MAITALPGSISTSVATPITGIISASSIAWASMSHAGMPIPSLSPTQPSSTPPATQRPTIPRVITFKVLPTIDAREDYARTTTESPMSGAPGEAYLNVTSQSGTHAYLPCNVKQLVKKPVSWIRVRDGHILTVDQTTFIADQRFQSIVSSSSEKWSLQIKYVQLRDAGWYECQVSTEPKTSARVRLHVVEPRTVAFGEANRHVKAGSQVTLRCIVKGALEPPLFFNWYFDRKQIFFHNLNPNQKQNPNSWRTEIDKPTTIEGNSSDNHNIDASASTDTVASLIIPSVTKKDSGNYTCSPSSSESITFVLHVLNGEYSASAITSRSCDSFQRNLVWLIVMIIIQSLQVFFRRSQLWQHTLETMKYH
ncbi:zwei Ig domain protein zig-8-like isoform X2 [Hermetia illucens]|nr:zwei Ig domain protein zig-8-like isoform X2 [Hermetia illucens]